VGSDSKNGVRHQRALSPRLSMMMMMMRQLSHFLVSEVGYEPTPTFVSEVLQCKEGGTEKDFDQILNLGTTVLKYRFA